jgi:hypothetical protein
LNGPAVSIPNLPGKGHSFRHLIEIIIFKRNYVNSYAKKQRRPKRLRKHSAIAALRLCERQFLANPDRFTNLALAGTIGIPA